VRSVAHVHNQHPYKGAGNHLSRTIAPPSREWSCKVHCKPKVLPSHTSTLPSMLAVAKRRMPFGAGLLNAMHSTDSVWPLRLVTTLPCSMCITLIVPSSEPDTTIGASGCEQMEITVPSCTCLTWCFGAPARGSHNDAPIFGTSTNKLAAKAPASTIHTVRVSFKNLH